MRPAVLVPRKGGRLLPTGTLETAISGERERSSQRSTTLEGRDDLSVRGSPRETMYARQWRDQSRARVLDRLGPLLGEEERGEVRTDVVYQADLKDVEPDTVDRTVERVGDPQSHHEPPSKNDTR